jgi:hypothetical protein
MARAGEKYITEPELESRLRKIEAKINGLLSFLVFTGAAEIKNFMVQTNRETISGTGTAVTFANPFKAGTVPVVVGTSENYNCYFALDGAPTATGFTARSRLHDGTASNSACGWIAIGERG